MGNTDLKERNTKYWIATVSQDHVLNGIELGIAQACHGKKAPLSRMESGDGLIFYSPKKQFESNERCQSFTGIGIVKNGDPYQVDMGNNFKPFRIDIDFFKNYQNIQLHLIPIERRKWSNKFRFGHFEISKMDFSYISSCMHISEKDINEKQKRYID